MGSLAGELAQVMVRRVLMGRVGCLSLEMVMVRG